MLYLPAASTGPVARAGAAIGDSDGATIGLAKSDPNGNFSFTNLPDGNYGVVIFDQWNDIILDGSSHAVNLAGGQTRSCSPSFTWPAHLFSRVYTAGKLLDPWRRRVNCLFGLALNRGFINNTTTQTGTAAAPNPFDPNPTPKDNGIQAIGRHHDGGARQGPKRSTY